MKIRLDLAMAAGIAYQNYFSIWSPKLKTIQCYVYVLQLVTLVQDHNLGHFLPACYGLAKMLLNINELDTVDELVVNLAQSKQISYGGSFAGASHPTDI